MMGHAKVCTIPLVCFLAQGELWNLRMNKVFWGVGGEIFHSAISLGAWEFKFHK